MGAFCCQSGDGAMLVVQPDLDYRDVVSLCDACKELRRARAITARVRIDAGCTSLCVYLSRAQVADLRMSLDNLLRKFDHGAPA
jgi:hypothetical protein